MFSPLSALSRSGSSPSTSFSGTSKSARHVAKPKRSPILCRVRSFYPSTSTPVLRSAHQCRLLRFRRAALLPPWPRALRSLRSSTRQSDPSLCSHGTGLVCAMKSNVPRPSPVPFSAAVPTFTMKLHLLLLRVTTTTRCRLTHRDRDTCPGRSEEAVVRTMHFPG